MTRKLLGRDALALAEKGDGPAMDAINKHRTPKTTAAVNAFAEFYVDIIDGMTQDEANVLNAHILMDVAHSMCMDDGEEDPC